MSKLLINGFRLLMCSVYPLIIVLSFYLIYRKKSYKTVIHAHFKEMAINTLIVILIGLIGFTVFFKLENFIYDFDYVGHWYRALVMREKFFLEPLSIPAFLHNSLNYDVYFSYLIAFFQLPIVIIRQTYGFFCLGSFLYFYIPVFVLLQILYFKYIQGHKYLPVLIAVVFFQMYLCFFDGETECFGSFFIILASMLTIFIDFKEIDMMDNLMINLCGYILIFGRRFYLYALISIYFCYFVHYLVHHKFKVFNKEAGIDFLKIVSSGIILLGLCLTIYLPFFLRVVTNNYSEAYAYNNRDGKLLALVYCFSPLITLITAYGFMLALKDKKKFELNFELLFSVVFPTFLFWRVQSFELHHYYMISFPFIVYFTLAMVSFFDMKKKVIPVVLSGLLVLQAGSIFVSTKPSHIISDFFRYPKVYPDKERVAEFSNYLASLTSNGSYIYMATGNGLINYSYLMNANLPSLKNPNFLESTYDLRDGFPVNLKYCDYLIISDPITYSNKENQKVFDVITDAVKNVDCVKEIYNCIYQIEIHGNTYSVYRRTADFTDEIKNHFYTQMIHHYPGYEDFFSNILE